MHVDHRGRPRAAARSSPEIRTTQSSAAEVAFFDVDDSTRNRDRAIEPNSLAATEPFASPAGYGPGRRLSGKGRRRSRSLRRHPGSLSSSSTVRSGGDRLPPSASAVTPEDARNLVFPLSADPAPRARRSLEMVWQVLEATALGGRERADPRPVAQTCSPTAGSCIRLWPSRFWGAQADTISPAARSVFPATNLQDVMALISRPSRASYGAPPGPSAPRASFREGDVQHWWHPPAGPRRSHPLL